MSLADDKSDGDGDRAAGFNFGGSGNTTEPLAKAARVVAESTQRENLPEEIIIELLGATGPITITAIGDGVNAKPGPYVARGPVEAELDRLLALDPPQVRKTPSAFTGGESEYALTAEGRSLYETPGKVVDRRTAVLATMALHLFPEADALTTLEGLFLDELDELLRGIRGPGAMTGSGFQKLEIAPDVLRGDLDMLIGQGVLMTRGAAEEMKLRSASDEIDVDEEDEGDDEAEEDADHEDEDPEAPVSVPPAEDRGPAYTFAPGRVPRGLVEMARAMALPTVPAAPPAVVEAAAASATDAERVTFEKKAMRQLDAERTARAAAEQTVARLRTHLASKRLEHLVDEAMGPPRASVPARKTFPFTQTVPMNDAERAVLLDEIAVVQRKLAEEEARIEGAKLAAASAKSMAKEATKALKEQGGELLALRNAKERTYTVEAYSVLDTGGPVAVNRIFAVSDDRLLREEELTPAQALQAAAAAPGKPADPPADPPVDEAPPAPPETPPEEPKPSGGAPAATTLEPGAPKTLNLSVPGFRPHIVAAVAAAGEAGILVEKLGDAFAQETGTLIAGPVKTILTAATKAVLADKLLIQTGDRLHYPAERIVMELVTAAGEVGLRVVDLPDHFEQKTAITTATRPDLVAFLGTAADHLVTANALSRGPLAGTLGDLLWLQGTPDPRTLGHQPKPEAPPSKVAQGPKAKKGAGKSNAKGKGGKSKK